MSWIKSAGTKLAATNQHYIRHRCGVFIPTGRVQDGSSSHGIILTKISLVKKSILNFFFKSQTKASTYDQI